MQYKMAAMEKEKGNLQMRLSSLEEANEEAMVALEDKDREFL